MSNQRKGKKKPTLKERRAAKRDSVAASLESLEFNLEAVQGQKDQVELLASVARGLYDELDKLSKKAPVDEATDLVVDHVNALIGDVRSLASEDPYIQRVQPFVPAGNNPEHRDVLVVLRQLRQGLDRFAKSLPEREKRLGNRIALAHGLVVALDLYVSHAMTQIDRDAIWAQGAALPADWWTAIGYGEDQVVDLARIDEFDADSLLRDVE